MLKAKVLLVEDNVVLRRSLKSLFANESDFEIVDEANNGQVALKRASELQPDLVLMDLSMPGLNSIETTRQILQRHPKIKIVILSMHSNEEYILQALQAGAAGYVLKQSGSAELITAIRAVLCDGSFLSSSISRTVIDSYMRRAQARGRDMN